MDVISFRIRDAAPDEFHAIAEVRVRGWQYAYQGLVPQAYLDALSVPEVAERLRGSIASRRATHVVAEADGTVVGWGCVGPGRDPDATAAQCEVYALYVLPEWLDQGVGRGLMAELTARAEAAGFHEIRLWVLKENHRARRFYAKAGFVADGGEEPFEVGGVQVPEVRYGRALGAPPRH
ncbi:GNAT family N-acetyltransferase [Streptomyces sp. NPDC020965]|uniref:GNAT family N-acetyltransferase n=1 Tax=Streptomyces sp. NPDC020965 TaxID=3365105 RepID=UPI0037A133E4